MPVGPTAKVRQEDMARRLTAQLIETGAALGVQVSVLQTDGTQPVGRASAPRAGAREILQVLRRDAGAPHDLRARSLTLAGALLELGGAAAPARGLARRHRDAGLRRTRGRSSAPSAPRRAACANPRSRNTNTRKSWPNAAAWSRTWNMRSLAMAAKLAGAPADLAAGTEMHVRRGRGGRARARPPDTMHADTQGELHYALDYLKSHPETLSIENPVR